MNCSNKINLINENNYNGINVCLGLFESVDTKIYQIQKEYGIYKTLNEEQKIIQKKYLDKLEKEIFEEIKNLEEEK